MNFDVVIAGAGMVGAALAAALGRAGLSVAVVDRAPPRQPQTDVDLRVSAVSPTSQQILTSLGVWPGIAAVRVGPFRSMRVWDAVNGSQLAFDAAGLRLPVLGHIVENALIQRQLWSVLETLPNVVLYCPDEVTDLHPRKTQALVDLAGGATLRCALVVGADGARSRIRELASIEVTGSDYDQHAVVCHVATQMPHGQCARQCFQPSGPVAFLPLADGRCSVVWSTSPAAARELLELTPEDFSGRLSEAFQDRLGTVELASERAAFPLHLQWSKRTLGERVALVGDAAHVVHPLAGLGVNLGFKDAAALAEVLERVFHRGQDLGAHHVLRRYERWRKGDNMITATTLHGIKHLFGSAFPPLAWLRGMGIGAVSTLGPVRNAFARYAVGQTGDLPRMARMHTGLPQ